MTSVGLQYLLRMGCICGKESLTINNRRFYIRARLGEGGFSLIDLVEDAHTHKLYALKRITCHGKGDERVANWEIEVMKMFKYVNLVPLEESGTITAGYHIQSGDPITEVLIVMPFYKRGSIQEKITSLAKKGEKMSEETIWSVFYGVCKAVKEMHSHNPPYAHRDIKPGNVMLDDNGIPVLMDLGSVNTARVEIKTRSEAQALQDEAAERCSMLFRPPELFNVEPGTNIDERTDIWSLGCLLYTMAFLESPFEKVYQRGDSIALAVMGRNIQFPSNAGVSQYTVAFLESPFEKVYQQGDSIALAVMGRNIQFPSNAGYTSAIEEMICECMVVNPMERPFIDQILNKTQMLAKSSSHVA